jgi:hypothetical protein
MPPKLHYPQRRRSSVDCLLQLDVPYFSIPNIHISGKVVPLYQCSVQKPHYLLNYHNTSSIGRSFPSYRFPIYDLFSTEPVIVRQRHKCNVHRGRNDWLPNLMRHSRSAGLNKSQSGPTTAQ